MEKQSLIEQLKLKNPEIALYTVGDPAFSDYGQVLSFDTVSLEETASKLSTPGKRSAIYGYRTDIGILSADERYTR